MLARQLRSFSAELMKLATGVVDADIRKLLAMRKGEEFLPGGELQANTTTPHEKLAANSALMTSMINFKANKKDDTPYQAARDWGWTGVRGATAGAGLTKLVKDMKGQHMAPHHYRKGVAIGTSVALGDRLWRHRHELGKHPEKTATVQPNPGSSFKSPATALHTGQETGQFHAKSVHHMAAPKPLQIGKKFRLPGGMI